MPRVFPIIVKKIIQSSAVAFKFTEEEQRKEGVKFSLKLSQSHQIQDVLAPKIGLKDEVQRKEGFKLAFAPLESVQRQDVFALNPKLPESVQHKELAIIDKLILREAINHEDAYRTPSVTLKPPETEQRSEVFALKPLLLVEKRQEKDKTKFALTLTDVTKEIKFVVPPNVTAITAELTGAGGGSSATPNVGGKGGLTKVTLAVVGGEVPKLFIGEAGKAGAGAVAGAGGKSGGRTSGGVGGTSTIKSAGGGGGGHTEIEQSAKRVIAAGGGGGGAGNVGGSAAAGKPNTGGKGEGTSGAGTAEGGGGGTETTGGAGGAAGTGGVEAGKPGTSLTGGAGAGGAAECGGGGGGGRFGGGGGGSNLTKGGGGGAGSDIAEIGTFLEFATTTNAGNGKIVLSWEA